MNTMNETRIWFPRDLRLRFHGAAIHSRRKGKEPVWRYKGQLWDEEELCRLLEIDEPDF